jgi:hypothetical protein
MRDGPVATRLLTHQGDLVLAARTHAVASTWRTQGDVSVLGGPLRWVVPRLSEYDAELQFLRDALGDEGFTAAREGGSRLSLEDMVAEVRASLCSLPADPM